VTILYGIKNCDTVKKARKWLDDQQISYQFHDFRADGLTSRQVQTWIDQLGLETLVNKRSTTWKDLDDSVKADFNEASATALIVEHPTLIKRPLLERAGSYHVGFKADDYQRIFA